MAIELLPLPFAPDALAARGMSKETLDHHYGKHHRGYVETLDALVAGTEHADSTLEMIIAAAERGPLFDNAAQAWNHSFFWNCLSPNGGGAPSGELAERLSRAFGSTKAFRDEFAQAATSHFGSGWAWLVDDGSGLSVTTTANADLPLAHGARALLTLDLWEHAYYLDCRNARADYVDNFFEQLVNWSFVAKRLSAG